ncbi:MAG: LysR family transcriptional regulator [Pseudomonadota bacterium]
MDKWTELHTAFSVARLGTISAAANALNVHRATVIRHINSLENELDTKLFFRHARGYSLTEAGEDMLTTATIVDKHLQKLRGLSRQVTTISGNLAISSREVVEKVLLRAVGAFKDKHSRATVSLQTEQTATDLETRRADISIHEGEAPTDLDHVVLPFVRAQFGLYAHQDYLKQHGIPQTIEDLAKLHYIALTEDKRVDVFERWLQLEGHTPHIVLRSNSLLTAVEAIKTGIGVGFCPNDFVKNDPDIFSVWPQQDEWCVNYWIVTHMDAHRSAKVQAFVEILRGLGFLGRSIPTL